MGVPQNLQTTFFQIVHFFFKTSSFWDIYLFIQNVVLGSYSKYLKNNEEVKTINTNAEIDTFAISSTLKSYFGSVETQFPIVHISILN